MRPARATEIETRVAELIDIRFGGRFQRTLKKVAEESILLSKMPEGIPIFLRAREHLTFFSLNELKVTKIESTASRGREIEDEARSVYRQSMKETPFGLPKGNGNFLTRIDIRFKEHYARYLCITADLNQHTAERLASAHLDKPSIVVTTGGAALLCDAGYLIANTPAVLLELPSELQKHMDGCLGWLKSSFFIWYCAVHLSEKDLYQQLQKKDIRLPFPNVAYEDFYRRFGGLVRNVVIEERKFLDEAHKQLSRGTDSRAREKLRTRHNNTLNGVCLTMEHEVNKVLCLTEEEIEFVARSICDMGLTDFGMLEQIENDKREAVDAADDEN